MMKQQVMVKMVLWRSQKIVLCLILVLIPFMAESLSIGPIVDCSKSSWGASSTTSDKLLATYQQQPSYIVTRRSACITAALSANIFFAAPSSVFAFEGGVGGLGKTRPQTGVVFFSGSEPLQQGGHVSAELVVGSNNNVLVGFDTPWPLLSTTAGLEARDLQNSESAFVQVVDGAMPTSSAALKNLLLETVLSSQGKFGAYGSPTDVKAKRLDTSESTSPSPVAVYSVTFTTLTPGQRESERQVYITPIAVGKSDLLLLITGTTRLRFKSQETLMRSIAESFTAVPAPQTRLAR